MTATTDTRFHFQFDLPPFGKERPRLAVMGRGKKSWAVAYTPEKTKIYETAVRAATLEQMRDNGVDVIPADRPIHINCVFCMPRAKTQSHSQYHLKTPDIDNLVKAILDGLQGALLEDDKSVVSLSVTKRYSGLDGYVGTLLSVTLLPVDETIPTAKRSLQSDSAGQQQNAKPTRKKAADAAAKTNTIEYPVTKLPASPRVQQIGRRAAKTAKRKKQTRSADGPARRRGTQAGDVAKGNVRTKMLHGIQGPQRSSTVGMGSNPNPIREVAGD